MARGRRSLTPVACGARAARAVTPAPPVQFRLPRVSSEPLLGQDHVDALLAVDDLRDLEIGSEAEQHICLIAREMRAAGHQLDHVAHRLAHRLVEILVEAHRDQLVGGFGEGGLDLEVLAHGQAETSLERRLDGGDADLAIPLATMAIAGGEQRARVEHRQIERRARAQILVVHIAAEGARLGRANPAPDRRRRNPHDAEERIERQLHAPGQGAGARLGIDRDMDRLVIGELVGQRAQKRQDPGKAPVLNRLHVQNVDLQNIARLGAAHIDRPGHHMRPRPLVAGLGLERDQVIRAHALVAGRQIRLDAGRHAGQHDLVARVDFQHRRRGRVEIAPEDIFGLSRQLVSLSAHVSLRSSGVSSDGQEPPDPFGVHVGAPALFGDLAAVDHDVAVRQRGGEIVILLDQQDRHPPLEAADHVLDRLHDRGLDPLGRFVEHQKSRAHRQGAADRQLLLLPAREIATAPVPHLAQNRKQRRHLVARGPAVGDLMRGHHDLDVLPDRQIGKDLAPLRNIADAQPRALIGRRMGDVLPVETDVAPGGRHQPHDGLQQCRLAGAVPAQKRAAGALLDAESDAIEHFGRAIGLRKIVHRQKHGHRPR
ncbi:hypothetical protein SDC9_50785 [bioreactor metagenome]|uniref:Uncharacterized protein n=1 Tax=bioreactor metagenome TaxID=1076179 RepID=A0A644WLP8_9ZZZZ